jgi:hypothetical protein
MNVRQDMKRRVNGPHNKALKLVASCRVGIDPW